MTATKADESTRTSEATDISAAAGTLLAWGRNTSGQLGDGTTTNRLLPVPVPGLTNVIALAEGAGHSLAVLGNGTVRAWGNNGNGQLGDGTKIDRLVPQPVGGLAGVVAVAAGAAHSLALLADGRLFGWGRNVFGQLGLGSAGADRLTPVQMPVPGGSRVKAIAAGNDFTMVLLTGATVLTCGQNGDGQLGDGTTTSRSTFGVIPAQTAVKAISAGGRHGLLLTSSGQVRAWGNNNDGQLGNGSTVDNPRPTTVNGLAAPAVAVACGRDHSLALLSTGLVAGWGSNSDGQLGDGSFTSPRLLPVSTAVGAGATVAIDAGFGHSLALQVNGTVRAWGLNSDGQLGDGTVASRATPTNVSGLAGITAVVAAGNSSFAVQ